jgi:RNA polymerase sigma factor (sigma-70 family)
VEYRPSLVKAALRIVRNWEAAEDVVQVALNKAYANLEVGRPYVMPKNRLVPLVDSRAKVRERGQENKEIEDVEAWLHAIVRNVAFNYLRGKQRRMDEEMKIGQLVEETVGKYEGPERLVLLREEVEELCRLIETLPSAYAAVIRLRYLREYEYQEIAEELRCPIGTVKSCVHRGLEMLREARRGQRVVKNGQMARRRRVLVS